MRPALWLAAIGRTQGLEAECVSNRRRPVAVPGPAIAVPTDTFGDSSEVLDCRSIAVANLSAIVTVARIVGVPLPCGALEIDDHVRNAVVSVLADLVSLSLLVRVVGVLILKGPVRPVIVVSGQWARTNAAIAAYLRKNHKRLRRRFGDRAFGLVLPTETLIGMAGR